MTDRRRIVGPTGITSPPIFASSMIPAQAIDSMFPGASRDPRNIRKIFLKTGLSPSASGSAYLELEPPSHPAEGSFVLPPSTLKLTCTVHGPRPLPRSTSFSPNILLSTHVKFAPFATRRRRGYLRDVTERDLAVHLETALRGIIISDRWPKSGVEVIITVLEGEDDLAFAGAFADRGIQMPKGLGGLDIMSILSGCITVASAAIIDAGIDCVDVVSGGVAALVKNPPDGKWSVFTKPDLASGYQIVLDPTPSEYEHIVALCVVGYLKARDEVTEVWIRGSVPAHSRADSTSEDLVELLIEGAIRTASATNSVIIDLFKETNKGRI